MTDIADAANIAGMAFDVVAIAADGVDAPDLPKVVVYRSGLLST